MLQGDKSWEDLNIDPDFIKILKENNFTQPSVVQAQFLEKLENNKNSNALVEAPTGSGKTLAYLLAAQQVIDTTKQQSQVLIIAHTIVLVQQIAAVAKKLHLQYSMCVGQEQHIQFVPNQHLIIATPKAYLSNFDVQKSRGAQIAARNKNSDISLTIFDEADYYFDQDDGREAQKIVKTLPKNCRIMLFSATLEEKERINMKKTLFINRKGSKDEKDGSINISCKVNLNNYHHIFLKVKNDDEKLQAVKTAFQLDALEAGFQAIVFCKTKKGVEQVQQQLYNDGVSSSYIHGDLTREAKDEQMKKFIDGDTCTLITTDMFARGIDIATMALVINYDLPCTKKGNSNQLVVSPITYIHRTGRAGRFGKKGICISLVQNSETDDFKEIQSYVQKKYDSTEFKEISLDQMQESINKLFEEDLDQAEELREQQAKFAEQVEIVSKREEVKEDKQKDKQDSKKQETEK